MYRGFVIKVMMMSLSGCCQEQRAETLKTDNENTRDVTCQGQPGDSLEVPEEGDFLDTHSHHAGSRTDDEQRTTHTGAEGEQVPEQAVRQRSSDRDRRFLQEPYLQTS